MDRPASNVRIRSHNVGRNADGRLEIFGVGDNNALWQKWQVAPNGGWSGWKTLGTPMMASINSLTRAVALVALTGAPALAQNSPAVLPVSPPGSIQPTGTWGLASLDKGTLYIAGMRGIDPTTNKLVDGAEARIRQAFLNMQHIAESQGATLEDCLRIVVYTTDMYRYRPLANKVQQELWSNGPYPPRTIIEVHRLNDDDILEVEGTFHVPAKTVSASRSKPSKYRTHRMHD
jgi:2-iminobutanoate/2-iminopropanoate deaminase